MRALQEVWHPLATRLEPLLSLRLESQLRLGAPARVLGTPNVPPPAAADAPPEATLATSEEGAPEATAEVGGAAASDHGFTIAEEELPFFVDSDAWSLGFGRTGSGHANPLGPDPHLIPESVLQFVAYVPGRARQPLAISGDPPAAGFVSPGWGGVTLVNAAADGAGLLPAAAEAAFFGSALQQMRQLFDLPERPAAQRGRVAVTPPGAKLLADWELDVLLRGRLRALLADAAATTVTLLDLVRAAAAAVRRITLQLRYLPRSGALRGPAARSDRPGPLTTKGFDQTQAT